MIDLDTELPAIAAGDADAFARFVAGAETRVRESLASFAAVIDVEAIVQECLLRVWQVAPRVEPDGRSNSLLRFSIRVARNLAVSETRRRRVDPALTSRLEREVIDDACEPAVSDPLLREVIARCREKLPDKPAQALAARLDGPWRADAEIAATLGMRANTFLQNFGRARRLLAECLGKHGIDVAKELA
jgi:RNA polymerase sigma-70 factor (ECF subfamily)